MIKAKKTERGYGPILICDICGEKLDRMFVVTYDMKKYWEQKVGELIDVYTICRPCDQKKGHYDAWDEGRHFLDNLIHNTNARLTKQDKENMRILDLF